MDVAGSAVGIASLGIQVCQGLLFYYDGWKDFKSDISNAYESIVDLSQNLALLEASLQSKELDQERTKRVLRCLASCKEGILNLSTKLTKLQTYSDPQGIRQKAQAAAQRSFYPFRRDTLDRLRRIVDDIRDRLTHATDLLHLDLSIKTHRKLSSAAADMGDVAQRARAIEDSLRQLHEDVLAAQHSFEEVVQWLSPPNPWTDHGSAQNLRVSDTGTWLLESDLYKRWKAGSINHIWLSGIVGCGKTVLCSTAFDNVQSHGHTLVDVGIAMFYFTTSDAQKQSYENLLSSMVAQLGWKEPSATMLRQKKDTRSIPSSSELEDILLTSIHSYKVVFLFLDALDECMESEALQGVLDLIEHRLLPEVPHLKVFATSRELPEVRDCMENIQAHTIAITAQSVDDDIQRYVLKELSTDRQLMKLDEKTKTLVEKTIMTKADGMFRLVFYQLKELRGLKSTRPKYIEETLRHLPKDLNAVYETTLTRIKEIVRPEALVLLRWLAYAESPPSLGELAEATIIDLTSTGTATVDEDNRASVHDTLTILSGLIMISEVDYDGESDKDVYDLREILDPDQHSPQIGENTRVKLAHASVKEYLESKEILTGSAKDFHFERAREHGFIAQSCLAYIMHYSSSRRRSTEPTSTQEDLTNFPLLGYAASAWFYHSKFQQTHSVDVTREMALLTSPDMMLDWLRLYNPDRPREERCGCSDEQSHHSLYFASLLGLEQVVAALLSEGVDVNTQGGGHGNALQAASYKGHESLVKTLIDSGADVNPVQQCGWNGNALQAASINGHVNIVKMLINSGANVNAQGRGSYRTALQASSSQGHEKVAQVLVESGANVNARGGRFGNALHIASSRGHEKVVDLLLKGGADIDAEGGGTSNTTALQAASYEGHEKVVRFLIDNGANVNAACGEHINALQAASYGGHVSVAEILIGAGVDVNAQATYQDTSLYTASNEGHEKLVQLLIDHGANVNAQGGRYANPLQAASVKGCGKVAQYLIDNGANVNALGGQFFNDALQAASYEGHVEVVQMLIDSGADVNALGGNYGTALQSASYKGHLEVARVLINNGAKINARGGEFFNDALQAASFQGHEKVVKTLIDNGADVNAPEGKSGTSLQCASYKGSVDVVQMLIDNGADINAPRGYYGTALECALKERHKTVARILIHYGADVSNLINCSSATDLIADLIHASCGAAQPNGTIEQ